MSTVANFRGPTRIVQTRVFETRSDFTTGVLRKSSRVSVVISDSQERKRLRFVGSFTHACAGLGCETCASLTFLRSLSRPAVFEVSESPAPGSSR